MFDEFQRATSRFAADNHEKTMDWIKHLVKESEVPMIMVGMPFIETFVRYHPQLMGFTQYWFRLRKFGYSTEAEREGFRKFLREIDGALPFTTPQD